MKTNTYCRRLGRQTLSGWRDRSDPDVAIKAYGGQSSTEEGNLWTPMAMVVKAISKTCFQPSKLMKYTFTLLYIFIYNTHLYKFLPIANTE